jgi:hypothetical protein
MKPLQNAFDHRVPKPPRINSKEKLAWLAENVLKLEAIREDYSIEFSFHGPKDQVFVGKIHSSSLDNAIIRAMHGIWHPQPWDWSQFWTSDPALKWRPELSQYDGFAPLSSVPCGCGGFYQYLNGQ